MTMPLTDHGSEAIATQMRMPAPPARSRPAILVPMHMHTPQVRRNRAAIVVAVDTTMRPAHTQLTRIWSVHMAEPHLPQQILATHIRAQRILVPDTTATRPMATLIPPRI